MIQLQELRNRAVTCINIAAKTDQFFELPKIDIAARTPIFAELRACDCTSDESETWGNTASFQLFISNTIAAIGEPTSFVTYKVIVKEGYLCQKLHCPIDKRDQLYEKSCCNGFQFKQVREPSDPPENGLEVMKAQLDGPISKATSSAAAWAVSLVCSIPSQPPMCA